MTKEFYYEVREICDKVREDLNESPEKENVLREKLIKALNFINLFFEKRAYLNSNMAIEEARVSAGDLKTYFDKVLCIHYSTDSNISEYSLLADYLKAHKMAPENALVFIFLANGIFITMRAGGTRYKINHDEVLSVLPYEFRDIMHDPKKYFYIMTPEEKKPLFDYSRSSFYSAPKKRDMTPDEDDVHIMERLLSLDEKIRAVSMEERKNPSKFSILKHLYLMDRFLEIFIDSLTDYELSFTFSERDKDEIAKVIFSLDDDRKERVINSLPDIQEKIIREELIETKEDEFFYYVEKVFFLKDAGTGLYGHYLNESSFVSLYSKVFELLDKRAETKEIEAIMKSGNREYARASTMYKSDMVKY